MKKRMTALFLIFCLSVVGCGSAQTERESGEESAVALTINGEEISLREWNFYIRMNQMQWEKDYMEEYGDEMWDQEVSDDGTTMADSLKSEVLDWIVQVHLLNQHAEEYDAALSVEDEEQLRGQAADFMETYHEALLEFAQADETFVYEKLSEVKLSDRVSEAVTADYDPEIPEEDYLREGICYVLISTTGLWDADGAFTPFTDKEVERRTSLAQELSQAARESGSLKESAAEEGLTAIESSMGAENEGDGQEPLMLDAARELEVGEVSDPVWTEEGWFVVQHTSDYDETGTEYWKQYLADAAREERFAQIYGEWEETAEITVDQEKLDQITVKHLLKELL